MITNSLFDLFFDKDFSCNFREKVQDWTLVDGDRPNVKTLIIKAIGINEKDLKVSVETINSIDLLTIVGETNIPKLKEKFPIKNRFQIRANEVKEISYYTLDGFIYIDIEYIETQKHNIKIRKK